MNTRSRSAASSVVIASPNSKGLLLSPKFKGTPAKFKGLYARPALSAASPSPAAPKHKSRLGKENTPNKPAHIPRIASHGKVGAICVITANENKEKVSKVL